MSAATLKSPGMKRICTSCGVRFYDLNKRPIVCPACSTEFTGDVKVKVRRGRLPVDAKKEGLVEEAQVTELDEDILEEEDGIEVVSLEDAEVDDEDEEDDAAIDLDDDLDAIPDFDDELEDDLEEDDTLLEEED